MNLLISLERHPSVFFLVLSVLDPNKADPHTREAGTTESFYYLIYPFQLSIKYKTNLVMKAATGIKSGCISSHHAWFVSSCCTVPLLMGDLQAKQVPSGTN